MYSAWRWKICHRTSVPFRKVQRGWDTLRLPCAKKLLPRRGARRRLGIPQRCYSILGSSCSLSAAQQVDDNHDECDHQQDVDQPAGDVHAETEQPQD